MKRFRDDPFWAAAAVVLVCGVPGAVLGGYSDRSLRLGLPYQLALAALAAVALTVTGWWRAVGMNGPAHWRHLHLTIIPAGAVLASMPLGLGLPVRIWVTYGLFALLIAFVKEVWFRGILFRALSGSVSPQRTVALSALLFGAVPAADMVGGAAPGTTLVRMFTAALAGYVAGALRLRTRSLWPGMLVMALFALAGHMQRLQAMRLMIPVGSDELAFRALLGLAIFGCARLWMRRAPEALLSEPEPESVQAG